MEDDVHKHLYATWFLLSPSYLSISASKEESNLQFNASAVWIRPSFNRHNVHQKELSSDNRKTEDNVALWKVSTMTV